MKVLILSAEFPPFSIGGISIHTYETCKYLSQHNWLVSVLTFQPDKENTDYGYSTMGDIKIYRVPRPINYSDDYQKTYANQNIQVKMGILNLFKDGHVYDLIVVHGYFLAEAALFAKDVFHAPLVYHAHTDYGLNDSLEDKAKSAGSLSCVCERALCNEAYSIIAVSYYLRRLLVANYGQFHKISIIPKGVYIDEYDQAMSEKKLKIVNDFKLIFVGRISRDKGIEVLLNAFSIAKKSIDYKLILYIVGTAINQKYLDFIKSVIRDLGIQNDVVFLGYKDQSEITRIYCECDIAVVPSYGETFGKVAIEAMAAKLPTIVSDIGGLGELVEHGKTGLKCEVGNVEQLSRCIKKLCSNKSLYKMISENAYQSVRENYNIKDVFEQTEQAYLEVISGL